MADSIMNTKCTFPTVPNEGLMNSLSLCRGSTVAMRGSRRVGEWSRERAEVDRNSYPLIASMRRRSFLSPVVVLTYVHM